MGMTVDSYVRAASTYEGAGFVKLNGSRGRQNAVQYGGRIFARKFGWYRKPTAEQNIAVRSNLLQALADSPENFSADAINAAARALGMQGAENIARAETPLSKREVLQVISQTRVYDRNARLKLTGCRREEVPEDLREQFDRVMAGGSDRDARDLVSQLNLHMLRRDDVAQAMDRVLAPEAAARFAGLRDELVDVCVNSLNIKASNLDHLESRAGILALVGGKVDSVVRNKVEAFRTIQDLAAPGEGGQPISQAEKDYLQDRCLTDPVFTSKAYVEILGKARHAGVDLVRAMAAPDASEKEIGDGFERLFQAEQDGLRESAAGGLGADEMMSLSADMLYLAGIDQGQTVRHGDELACSDSAKDRFNDLYVGLQFLNDWGDRQKDVRMPEGQLSQFAALRRVKSFFCRNDFKDDLRSLSQVDNVARNLARRFGVSIRDLDPFGAGRVSGEFGSNVDGLIIQDLAESVENALKGPDLDRQEASVVAKCRKDVARGYGLVLGGKVVNPAGGRGLPEEDLTAALHEFFTKDGVLDRKGLVAVTSFLNQETTCMMTMMMPTRGEGPLAQPLSTDGHTNGFTVARTPDGGYRVGYHYENTRVEFSGIMGTPGAVVLDGEAGNTFKCDFAVDVRTAGGEPRISTAGRATYEYSLGNPLSQEDVRALGRRNLADVLDPENINRRFARYLERNQDADRTPLTKAEIDAVASRATARGSVRIEDDPRVFTHADCNDCLDTSLRLFLENRAAPTQAD